MEINVDKVIGAYISLRDKIDAIETRHKDELRPHRDQLAKLETWLQVQLQAKGLQSLKGASGTVFLQEQTSATVEDWAEALSFLRDKEMWELLEKRVSKSVVQDYLESTGEIPPGIKYERRIVARVRRS